MPVKKKKSKKKSTAVDPNEDPDTMMADAPSGSGGKKKKVKKKKLTAAEKLKAKLHKGADTLLRSGAPFDDYMGRIELWLTKHAKKCVEVFKTFDLDQEGIVSYDEFKAGMLDMNVPLNAVELHLLCILFDKDETEEIEYRDLLEGFKSFREREMTYRPEDIRPALSPTKRNFEKCTCCKMPVWDGDNYKEEFPRYVQIHFKLMTFDNFKGHPAHFKKVVHSHVTVLSLMEIIRNETCLQTPKSLHQLVIFREKSYEMSAQLPESWTLEDCGFAGGPKDRPEHVDLYYDYKIEFKDCPLLMCDHYFGQNKLGQNKLERNSDVGL